MATKSKRKPKAKIGITTRLKQLLIEHGLDLPTDDLVSMLRKAGYTPSRPSVMTIATDFRQSCRILWELNAFKKPLKGLTHPRPGPEVSKPKAKKPKKMEAKAEPEVKTEEVAA